MPGKKWKTQEETQLKSLFYQNIATEEIAAKMGRTPGSVILKCKRLGLALKVGSDYEISLPRTLPSIEDSLKILAGALNAANQPGLDRVEVQRLQAISNIAKTYKNLFADYINYRKIELRLNEMEQLISTIGEKSQSLSLRTDAA